MLPRILGVGVLLAAVSPVFGQQPPTAADPPGDVRELKAAVQQLQQRLDQLAPPQSAPAERPVEEASHADADSALPLHAIWKNGLWLESAQQEFRIHLGGMVHFDAAWNAAGQAAQFGPGGIGELADGAYLRRARIQTDGTLYEHFEWKVQFDFANTAENDNGSSSQPIGSPAILDAWVGVNDLPVLGTLRVGWMKEPISFEHLTSADNLNFMERAPGSNSFNLTAPGITLLNRTENERVTWAAGLYHSTNNTFGFGVGDGQYAEAGRLTWLAWCRDEGEELVHLGLGASHMHLPDGQVNFRGRPSVRSEPGTLEPSLAETGTLKGTTADILDVELAGVYGPWTVQSEYFPVFAHDITKASDPTKPLGTLFYQGAYVEVLYFLTGEHQEYDKRAAVFGRVVPLHPFNLWGGEGGLGAWQVGVRYAYLDLQNKGVNGATLNDMVLGLNWFLNANLRVMWDLAVDHRSSTPTGSSGWTYIGGTRLALAF